MMRPTGVFRMNKAKTNCNPTPPIATRQGNLRLLLDISHAMPINTTMPNKLIKRMGESSNTFLEGWTSSS